VSSPSASTLRGRPSVSLGRAAHAYLASDARRTLQTALGLIWLLDGALQLQPFMYSPGFVHRLLETTAGQPQWLASSIELGAHALGSNLVLLNTLSALTQFLIGLGLLYRPTVKGALAISFAWSLVVWGLAEGCGLMFTGSASPLTGAPGAVLLYAILGLIAWPTAGPGGLLGVRGARTTWAALWLVMAWLWLLPANSTANAVASAIRSAPSGAHWLSSAKHNVASAASGNGLPIAIALAILSVAIGVAVAARWRSGTFLAFAVMLNLCYWIFGQGFGGILTGSGTDPNAGPLFVLFALALRSLTAPRASTPRLTSRWPRAAADRPPQAISGSGGA